MRPVASISFYFCAAILASGLANLLPRPVHAEEVDLQLLLAIDVSPSVDSEEYALQIHGLANALRNPEVVDAIATAAPNGVAVALMQWAGPREQVLSVDWSEVLDQASAEDFAAKIDAVERPVTNGGTSIGDAMARGMALLNESAFRGTRQVIDISGDGSTNLGNSPAPVRARAVSLGMTVNGLVILDEERDLHDYYLRRVIGGPGAFVLHIENFDDFAQAIRLKLIREILVAARSSPLLGDGIGFAVPGPRQGSAE
jgi:hypothetical protein